MKNKKNLLINLLIKREPHTRDFSHELGDQNSQHTEKSVCRDSI